MNRLFRTVVGCAALGVLPSVAAAQSSRSFDVCGGNFTGMSVLGFCAAADVAVSMINNKPTVVMNVWNMSGNQNLWDKSNPWTILVAIGLTNIIPKRVNVVNNSLRVSGPCYSNPAGCDYSQYWWIGNDFTLGALNVDIFSMDARGGGIVSNCDPNNPLITRAPYLTTACDRSSPNYVTMTFGVTETFDFANGGDLFLKGKLASGQTTYCVSGNNTPGCVPITAAPEPATLALLGSGLASMGGFGFLRRRRRPEQEA
jgi:hypothetical protein